MDCSDNQYQAAKLRQQAEQIFREKTSQLPEDLKTQLSEKKQEVFHELQVHQIELEMQNEELRRAQVELEAARTRYFDLYDLAPVGYVTVSEKGLILEANLTAATLLGVARSEMTKRPIAQFIFSKDQDAYYQYRKQLFETGTPQTSELRMVKRDGAIFWVWVSATVVQGADGLPVCRAVISDISERKRVEGELLETNHKLEQALAQAKAMADMAETANRTKSQFLANVSHEIRTPLSVMQGFSSILSDDMTLKPEQKQYVALIYKACNGLYQIVNDILDISKIESGKFKLQIAPFPMTKLLDDIESVMKPGANAKGLHFKVFRDEKHSAVVRADYNRVHQCLANLVGNAIKFTQKGHVHIRFSLEAHQSQSFLCFDVEDTGIGIPPDKHHYVFENFAQVNAGDTCEYGGTGLGLAITKQLAEQMGGQVSLSSHEGKGSVFSLRIPASADIVAQMEAPAGSSVANSLYPKQKPKFIGTILLVEDDEGCQILAKKVLKCFGLDPIVARNGNEALSRARSEPFDLILMDMRMPGVNGYEATQILRSEGITTPIVALTAYAMQGDREKCLNAGCSEYLSKPLAEKELYQVLHKHLSAQELTI